MWGGRFWGELIQGCCCWLLWACGDCLAVFWGLEEAHAARCKVCWLAGVAVLCCVAKFGLKETRGVSDKAAVGVIESEPAARV